MPQDKEPTISVPLKPLIIWLLAAVGGSVGGAAMYPDKRDVFDSSEWKKIEDRIQRAENRVEKIQTIEWRLVQLEKECAGE